MPTQVSSIAFLHVHPLCEACLLSTLVQQKVNKRWESEQRATKYAQSECWRSETCSRSEGPVSFWDENALAHILVCVCKRESTNYLLRVYFCNHSNCVVVFNTSNSLLPNRKIDSEHRTEKREKMSVPIFLADRTLVSADTEIIR